MNAQLEKKRSSSHLFRGGILGVNQAPFRHVIRLHEICDAVRVVLLFRAAVGAVGVQYSRQDFYVMQSQVLEPSIFHWNACQHGHKPLRSRPLESHRERSKTQSMYFLTSFSFLSVFSMSTFSRGRGRAGAWAEAAATIRTIASKHDLNNILSRLLRERETKVFDAVLVRSIPLLFIFHALPTDRPSRESGCH